MFSLRNTSLDTIESFVEKTNNSTRKFTAEMSETEIMFLDTKVYKGVRFDKESVVVFSLFFRIHYSILSVSVF